MLEDLPVPVATSIPNDMTHSNGSLSKSKSTSSMGIDTKPQNEPHRATEHAENTLRTSDETSEAKPERKFPKWFRPKGRKE